MAKYKCGDIFSFKLANKQYIFGRVLLDVRKQCVQPKLIKPDSALGFFSGTILVEIYEKQSETMDYAASPVLIPGVFVDTNAFDEGEWTVVGHDAVDPTKVEFPEALKGRSSHPHFFRGEVVLPLPSLDEDDLDKINVRPTIKSSYVLPDICLYYLGLKEYIEPEYRETSNLKGSDLRFSEHRHEIYRILGEDENESYYDMSTRLGYDVRRFYKSVSGARPYI